MDTEASNPQVAEKSDEIETGSAATSILSSTEDRTIDSIGLSQDTSEKISTVYWCRCLSFQSNRVCSSH